MRNLLKVTVISVGFFCLFTAFSPAQNLSSETIDSCGLGDLGFYSLGLLYLTFSIASFFSTAVVHKLGVKFSLVLGALCYSFWILSFLVPVYSSRNTDSTLFLFKKGFMYFLLLFSAMVNGFGASILWVAQGKYISNCATDETKAFFFSYFWGWFMMS